MAKAEGSGGTLVSLLRDEAFGLKKLDPLHGDLGNGDATGPRSTGESSPPSTRAATRSVYTSESVRGEVIVLEKTYLVLSALGEKGVGEANSSGDLLFDVAVVAPN